MMRIQLLTKSGKLTDPWKLENDVIYVGETMIMSFPADSTVYLKMDTSKGNMPFQLHLGNHTQACIATATIKLDSETPGVEIDPESKGFMCEAKISVSDMKDGWLIVHTSLDGTFRENPPSKLEKTPEYEVEKPAEPPAGDPHAAQQSTVEKPGESSAGEKLG